MNTVRAEVSGRDPAAFLSLAHANEIPLYAIGKKEKTLSFDCREKDCAVVSKIAARCGMTFVVKKRKNAATFARALLKHVGIAAALVVIAVSLVASRFFVLGIKVEGVSAANAEKITEYLYGKGFDGIIPKNSVDLEGLERDVSENVDGLAFAEAYFDGIRLVVNAREQLPEPSADEETGRIVASRDAIVTRVEVSGGTALVEAGDTVRAGDVLIDDKIIIGDPLDPEHKEVGTAAKGDVYGRTWYFTRLLVPEYRTEYVRTGRTYTSSSLYFGDRLVLSAAEKHGFTDYERVSVRESVKAIVPFTIETFTWYEVEKVKVRTDDAYLESEAFSAFAELSASLDPSATVTGSYKSQKKVDNLYIIIIYYEVEQLIGCREA